MAWAWRTAEYLGVNVNAQGDVSIWEGAILHGVFTAQGGVPTWGDTCIHEHLTAQGDVPAWGHAFIHEDIAGQGDVPSWGSAATQACLRRLAVPDRLCCVYYP